jgi:phage terminase large subunit-like protein
MLCDRPYWQSELAEWIAAFGDKIVQPFPTASWAKMAQAVERFDSALRGDSPTISHDGDPILRQHVMNAHKEYVNSRRPSAGFVLVKDRPGSPRKIDAAVAAVLANQARDQAIAEGWAPPAGAFAFVL